MAVGSEVSVSGVGDTAHSFYLSHEEWWRWWGGLKDLSYTVRRYRLCLTNSTEQSPSSKAASSSARQDTPCIFWNSPVHFRVRKRPTLVLIFMRDY